ncbi:essential MCU regulator, mitochondrial [Athalia rosae]|uniref:essential MCU regulator, mitochondrial n=1 Tax=Athalia rosae TaxID=37344 RepID=UPI0006257AC5|nr:essential MCU regulator, mitochondrial [Athalia rosae]
MSLHRVKLLLSGLNPPKKLSASKIFHQETRTVTNTRSGSLLPEPKKTPFGILGIICAVIPGLLIGATISKNMANFLEENELFVPSDDDDDDD